MEKDKIFFNASGLTTTSANHLANLAKEAYRNLECKLALVKFYTTSVGLFSTEVSKVTGKGIDDTELGNIKSDLMRIAQYKSLIAWLREAIKAKERLIKEATNLSKEEVAKALGIELPVEPEKVEVPTSDDVIASYGIKQRNRIYYLNTLCAQLGEYIHPGGTYANQREQLQKYLHEPYKVVDSGRDAMLYSYTPSCSTEKVDEVYFALQKEYREAQAELNSLMHEVETTIQMANNKANTEYSKALADYSLQMQEINARVKAYRDEQIALAQSLKIIIPDSLMAIYTEVSKMGKEK